MSWSLLADRVLIDSVARKAQSFAPRREAFARRSLDNWRQECLDLVVQLTGDPFGHRRRELVRIAEDTAADTPVPLPNTQWCQNIVVQELPTDNPYCWAGPALASIDATINAMSATRTLNGQYTQ